ncbi:MAG: hypothetical protein ACU85V_00075 [Gammaproteobacteria bacterium]
MTRKAKASFVLDVDDRTPGALRNAEARVVALGRSAGRAALGVGALGVALGAATVKAIGHADALAKNARAAGFASDTYQELIFLGSQMGVQQASMTSNLERFTKRLGEAANGIGAAAKEYERLGIAVRDDAGLVRDSEEVLRDVADAMAEMRTEAEVSASAAALFGREGIKLGQAFRGGSAVMDEYAQIARELGLVLDQSLLTNAEKASDQVDRMSRIVQAQGTVALANLFPTVIAVGNAFAAATPKVAEFFKVFSDESDTRMHGRMQAAQERLDELSRKLQLGRHRREMFGVEVIGRELDPKEIGEIVREIESLEEVIRNLRARMAETRAENLDAAGMVPDALDTGGFDSAVEEEKTERAIEAAQQRFSAIHQMKLQALGLDKEAEEARLSEDLLRLEREREALAEHLALTDELERQFDTAKEERIAAHEARLTEIEKQEAEKRQRAEQQVQQQITNFRAQATDLAIAMAQGLVGENKLAQIAILAVTKIIAAQDILMRGQQAAWLAQATIPPPAGQALAAKLIAASRLSAGLVLAGGAIQAAQIATGGGGGGFGQQTIGQGGFGGFGDGLAAPAGVAPGQQQATRVIRVEGIADGAAVSGSFVRNLLELLGEEIADGAGQRTIIQVAGAG